MNRNRQIPVNPRSYHIDKERSVVLGQVFNAVVLTVSKVPSTSSGSSPYEKCVREIRQAGFNRVHSDPAQAHVAGGHRTGQAE